MKKTNQKNGCCWAVRRVWSPLGQSANHSTRGGSHGFGRGGRALANPRAAIKIMNFPAGAVKWWSEIMTTTSRIRSQASIEARHFGWHQKVSSPPMIWVSLKDKRASLYASNLSSTLTLLTIYESKLPGKHLWDDKSAKHAQPHQSLLVLFGQIIC